MQTENQVVKSTATFLRANGYQVTSELSTIEHGIDIVATDAKGRRRILVEAKGATSSKPGTRRYGLTFTRAQCHTHLAVALLAVAKLREQLKPSERVAIALPDLEPHLTLVSEISGSLADLGVGMFWVSPRGDVRFDAPWKL